MKLIFLSVIGLICVCISGCNIINPSEPVPTYIRIDSFRLLQTDPSKTGSISQKITSAWVYYDNQAVGVFDIPGTIPVIASKAGQLQIRPGVTLGGIKSYETTYPFYTFDTFSISPMPGKVINHTPEVRYVADAKFSYIENFDLGNTFTKVNNALLTDTSIVRVDKSTNPDKVFEGSGAGYIYLNSTHSTSENINNDGFPITQGEVFLEINYKCDVAFEIGLQTTISGNIIYEYIAGMKPSNEWKKLYINIHDFVGNNKGSLYRTMIKTKLPDGQTTGYVLMDNIKVVCYQ